MPIAIILAVFVALFTLGVKMNQPARSAATMATMEAKRYNGLDKKADTSRLEVKMPVATDNSIQIKSESETGTFENVFQLFGLYQIIKAEPMNVISQSLNSNMKQAVGLSEKE